MFDSPYPDQFCSSLAGSLYFCQKELIMDKTTLAQLVSDGFSTREIAVKLKCSQTNVRYFLNTYNLRTNKTLKKAHCLKCGESDASKFYGRRKDYCGKCHNQDVKARGHSKRLKALDYLGGECKACGFDKYKTALDIHHLDPNQKDDNFASMRGWSWERIQIELDKCILLCRNCHSAVHNGELIFP